MKKLIIIMLLINLNLFAKYNKKHYNANIGKYADVIERYAMRYNINPLVIHAIICYENTRWNPKVVNCNNCVGLMQIKSDGTLKDIKKLQNPYTNIRLGIMILDWKIQKAGTLHGGLNLYGGSKKYADRIFKIFEVLEK